MGILAVSFGQNPMFDENIEITDYESQEVLMPPSPLDLQVLFVGGHDIVECTPTYGNPAGRAIAKEWHDFIGWTPDDSGNSLGWVTVNHEMIYEDDRIGDGGGMTAFRVDRDGNGGIQVLDQTLSDGREGQFFNVDFVNTVGETGMNCAGISAPDGRIWTAEEWFRGNTNSIWNGNFRGADRPDSWNPHSPQSASRISRPMVFRVSSLSHALVLTIGQSISSWPSGVWRKSICCTLIFKALSLRCCARRSRPLRRRRSTV